MSLLFKYIYCGDTRMLLLWQNMLQVALIKDNKMELDQNDLHNISNKV